MLSHEFTRDVRVTWTRRVTVEMERKIGSSDTEKLKLAGLGDECDLAV